jgi:prenyltransferase beta subunit
MIRRLLALSCLVCLAPAAAGQPDDVKATIAYVQKLQTGNGGFLSMEPKPNIRIAPTCGATSSAVRALKYLGGEVPNVEACKKFVESCYDATSGGFSGFPRGKPDVFTTAVGIMAVAELKMPLEKYEEGVIKYLSENVKSFDDVRIAVAGLERIAKKSPKTEEWLKIVGEYKGDPDPGPADPKSGIPRGVASIRVTCLRLVGKCDEPEATIALLQKGQRMNGGYGKGGTATSDLESTYRVMRAFVMLKSQPKNVEAIRSFVAKCRNADGGYGVSPGEESTVNGTYFAAIIRHWAKDMK